MTMCDHSLIAGVTGTGAARPGRGGARRRVRAIASGPRTGTAGQTGEQCHIRTNRVPFSFPIRFSRFKMLSNNYGNAEKEGEDDVFAVCVMMGEACLREDHNKTFSLCRRNVPSSGEFYCARGTYPRAGARSHGAGDWGPGQRRPGQRSEPQHSALTENRGETGPGNGLDRWVTCDDDE